MKKYFFPAAFLLLISIQPSIIFAQNDGNFGSKEISLLNLKGSIYALPDDTEGMPSNLDKQKSLGVIYTSKLDIPVRSFEEGFPGVTDRFEWFGLVYTGTFEIAKAGSYRWKIISDDGSRLWIDGKEVIDNDGTHGFEEKIGDAQLAKGRHSIKIWYYQGPATEIGLQLFVANTPATEDEEVPYEIFDLSNFSGNYSTAAKKVNAIATPKGIKVQLPDNILFDVAKSDLKSTAEETLNMVAELINTYPNCTVQIDGHTDATGKAEDNQLLSENRAKSVAAALQKRNIDKTIKLNTKGYGATSPVAANDTDAHRALNRRVDILIVP